MGRYRHRFTNNAFSETMGVHDSSRETSTAWAVKAEETKDEGEWRERPSNLQYSIGHVCKAASKAARQI